MNELLEITQAGMDSLRDNPDLMMNFGTIVVIAVVTIILKFLIKGVLKIALLVLILAVGYFWATGQEITFLSEFL